MNGSRRRVGEACDNCRRKKTKCNWRPPCCADCLRVGSICTFAGIERRTEAQDAVSAAKGDGSGIHSDPGNEPQANELTMPTQFQLDDLNEIDMAAILKQFFASVNHYLPIFINEQRLHDRLSKRTTSSLESLCASAIVISVAVLNGSVTVAERAMQHALSMIGWRFWSEHSLFAVQTIVMVIISLRALKIHEDLANNMLSAATRMVFALELHRLTDVTNISLEERLCKLQVYWTVYILDKESCMRHSIPPSIPDDEVDVLGIEPPRMPHLRSGLVQSLDSSTSLSLYTARQRLARIGGVIWKELYTAKTRVQPRRLQQEKVDQLNKQLRGWKEEWFELERDLPQHWPKTAIPHIIDLHFAYFEFILKANPGFLTSAVDVVDALRRGEDPVEPPSFLLDAARDVLLMARFRETSSNEQILADVRYAIPAIVLLLAHAVSAAGRFDEDIHLAKDGLIVLQHLTAQRNNHELKKNLDACNALMERACSHSR